jgi:hypothetical protein
MPRPLNGREHVNQFSTRTAAIECLQVKDVAARKPGLLMLRESGSALLDDGLRHGPGQHAPHPCKPGIEGRPMQEDRPGQIEVAGHRVEETLA